MDPKVVQKVDQEYGPFDWRLPYAHAIYWAEAYRLRTNANTNGCGHAAPVHFSDACRWPALSAGSSPARSPT